MEICPTLASKRIFPFFLDFFLQDSMKESEKSSVKFNFSRLIEKRNEKVFALLLIK